MRKLLLCDGCARKYRDGGYRLFQRRAMGPSEKKAVCGACGRKGWHTEYEISLRVRRDGEEQGGPCAG